MARKPASNPNREQLADTIVAKLNINSTTINSNLIHKFAQVDMSSGGVQAAAQSVDPARLDMVNGG